MVYYNPYKQFLRALIRSVRVFISSLFSKRLLLMIIVAFVIMLLHLNIQVQAETINENSHVYRTPILSNFNEEGNLYNLNGTFYSESGRVDVDIDIPNNMFTGSFFIAYFPTYGEYMLVRMHDQRTFDNFFLNYLKRDGAWHLYYSLSSRTAGLSNFDTLKYNSSNRTWVYDLNNASGNWYWDTTTPCNIIYQKSCTVYYAYQYISQFYSADSLINYTLFKTPELSYITDAFQLDLNGFSFYGQQFDDRYNNSTYTHKYQLEHLYISLYDINNDQFIFNQTDIINSINVVTEGYDDVTGYPIQSTTLDFGTFFNVLTNTSVNADYLIFVSPVLKDSYYYNEIPLNMAKFYENFNDVSYWRYQYNANTGVGSLVPTDSEGNPINPDEGGGEDSGNINTEEITNSINNINDFMQNDSFSSDSITDNMPSSEQFQDITESGFDNIFTTLKNAFTSDNYQDVEFVVPFSNGQKITIPSNLTENIIPTAIKTLIQMVYWYFIARFIVKDIASYIEKAKSGDIFSSSDTNIKTDML